MGALSQEQIDKFWGDGVLVAEDAVSAKELSCLKQVFEGWVEDSRSYSRVIGLTSQPCGVCNRQKKFRMFLRMLCEMRKLWTIA